MNTLPTVTIFEVECDRANSIDQVKFAGQDGFVAMPHPTSPGTYALLRVVGDEPPTPVWGGGAPGEGQRPREGGGAGGFWGAPPPHNPCSLGVVGGGGEQPPPPA